MGGSMNGGHTCKRCQKRLSWREAVYCFDCRGKMGAPKKAHIVFDIATGELVDESTERADGVSYQNSGEAA